MQMTPHGVLRARPGWLAVLLLAVLVLALHLAALAWLGEAFQPLAAGRLPEPIYTRLLRPTPPPSPAQKPTATSEPTRPAPRPETEQTTPAIPAPPPPTPPMPPPVETAAASVPAGPISAPQPPASAPAIASEPGNPGNASASSHASHPGGSAATHAASASLPIPPSSAPAAAAPAWPPSTKLSYTITGYWRGDLHGSGALVWTVDGNHYEATLSGSALVGFAYRSIGRIDGDWLAPERYTERLFTREKSVRFDRDNDTLHFSTSPGVVPLPPHVQDSASLFLQLANRLTRHPEAFHPGATLTFAVVRPSGMTDWTFTVAGMETVVTPVGPLSCWHIVRHATDPNQLGAQIWLSPQLQNLPVQIRLQHAADSYLLFTLDHAEQQAPPQSPASAAP
jgi:hypothetical protein